MLDADAQHTVLQKEHDQKQVTSLQYAAKAKKDEARASAAQEGLEHAEALGNQARIQRAQAAVATATARAQAATQNAEKSEKETEAARVRASMFAPATSAAARAKVNELDGKVTLQALQHALDVKETKLAIASNETASLEAEAVEIVSQGRAADEAVALAKNETGSNETHVHQLTVQANALKDQVQIAQTNAEEAQKAMAPLQVEAQSARNKVKAATLHQNMLQTAWNFHAKQAHFMELSARACIVISL